MTDERPTDNPDKPSGWSGTNDAASPPDSAETANAAGSAGGTIPDTGPIPGWTVSDGADDAAAADSGGAKMLSQLQAMIVSIATQATPVAKQIGVKAAELTAAAADRAGPFAHKAGDAAADASTKIAQRSRELAADLRRELAKASNGSSPTDDDPGAANDAGSTATAVMDRPGDEIADEAKPPENEPG
jgi:hypothetical protein